MGKPRNALRDFCAVLYSGSDSRKSHARDRQVGPVIWLRPFELGTPIRPHDILPNQVSKSGQFERPFCKVSVHNCQQGTQNTMRLTSNSLRKIRVCQKVHTSLLISKKQDWTLLCR